MYTQEYALLKCKCVNSKMHVQNTVNQTILLTLTYIIASRMWYSQASIIRGTWAY